MLPSTLSRPLSLNLAIRSGFPFPWITQRHASTSSRPRKVTKLAKDLPKQALDASGKPLSPLAPFSPNAIRGSLAASSSPGRTSRVKGRSSLRSITLSAAEEVEWHEAVKKGDYPDTALAKEIFANIKAYPGDILLTRVGMFYESYFTQAEEVARLLGIALTSKKFSKKDPKNPKESTTVSFPFSGFPIASKDKHFLRLLEQGRSFVVVEEMDEKVSGTAKNEAKRRFVSRKYTPGTMMSENWQAADENRYLMGIAVAEGAMWELDPRDVKLGLAYIDISTDRAFNTKSSTWGELEHELVRIGPVEVVLQSGVQGKVVDELTEMLQLAGISVTRVPLHPDGPTDRDLPPIEQSATQLAHQHLKECLLDEMPTLLPSNHQSTATMMQIDASTLLGLEIRHSLRNSAGTASPTGMHASPASRAGTLVSVIKRTLTPGGTRLLVNSLSQPSAHLPTITRRHDLVDGFLRRTALRRDLQEQLKQMSLKVRGGSGGSGGEIGRIVQKYLGKEGKAPLISTNTLMDGRDLWDLKETIDDIAYIQSRIQEELEQPAERSDYLSPTHARLEEVVARLRDLSDLSQRIGDSVIEEVVKNAVAGDEPPLEAEDFEGELEESPPTEKSAGKKKVMTSKERKAAKDEEDAMWWLKPTFSSDLLTRHASHEDLLARKVKMQEDLRVRFGITGLELKFGRFGFYMHVPLRKQGDADRAAAIEVAKDEFTRLEKGKSFRAYSNIEWTRLGVEIAESEDGIIEAQKEAATILRQDVCARQEDLLENAEALSEIDLALGFAQAAKELDLVRPEMHDGFDLVIENGRHPTVEYGLTHAGSTTRPFVPNSLRMDESSHLHVISGPNMGGKSTVLRQTAIMSILAQAGSFVPAEAARMGVVDAVFSRVGARDDLYQDKSTFMMEMHETAHILRRATKKSLVIMDEIGRGTTLLSGIAIAYATLDHLLKHIGCRTLFATHYHELADMLMVEQGKGKAAKPRKGVEFWCTDVAEEEGNFSYAYKLKPGVNRESHAIKVARNAGVPLSFLDTAKRVLDALEKDKEQSGKGEIFPRNWSEVVAEAGEAKAKE